MTGTCNCGCGQTLDRIAEAMVNAFGWSREQAEARVREAQETNGEDAVARLFARLEREARVSEAIIIELMRQAELTGSLFVNESTEDGRAVNYDGPIDVDELIDAILNKLEEP